MTTARGIVLAIFAAMFLLSIWNASSTKKTRHQDMDDRNAAATAPVIFGWLLGFAILHPVPELAVGFTVIMAIVLYKVCASRTPPQE